MQVGAPETDSVAHGFVTQRGPALILATLPGALRAIVGLDCLIQLNLPVATHPGSESVFEDFAALPTVCELVDLAQQSIVHHHRSYSGRAGRWRWITGESGAAPPAGALR